MSKIDEAQQLVSLAGAEAIEKLKELATKARNCMMVTNFDAFPHTARPMSLQEVEANGSLFFISAANSDKNKQLAEDPRIALYFQNNGSYEFLTVYGRAVIHTDKAMIEKYWTDFARAWFEGKDDPNVTILEVIPEDCSYWETENGKILAFLKMSFAAITGADMKDGGVEGKLSV